MEQNRCQPPGRRMLRPARAGFSRWPCFSGCRDFIYIHLCLFSPVGRETVWRLTQSFQGLSQDSPASPSCSRVRSLAGQLSPPALSHADAFCQQDVPAPFSFFAVHSDALISFYQGSIKARGQLGWRAGVRLLTLPHSGHACRWENNQPWDKSGR